MSFKNVRTTNLARSLSVTVHFKIANELKESIENEKF